MEAGTVAFSWVGEGRSRVFRKQVQLCDLQVRERRQVMAARQPAECPSLYILILSKRGAG